MKDKKMQMFLEKERWVKVLNKMHDKDVDSKLLIYLSDYSHIQALAEIIANGEYEPEYPRIVEIPKGNGKMREITVLTPFDRCVFAVIADVYYDLYSNRIDPHCVSYQRGISVPKIVNNIKLNFSKGGYKIDLTKYFDTVPIETVDKVLDSMYTGSPLDDVLDIYYHTDMCYVKGNLVHRYKSLSQGCAFSALLSNLVLADIDKKVSEMCLTYVRYVDDILFISDDNLKTKYILIEELNRIGLSVNPEKVQQLKPNEAFDFLGAKISVDGVSIADKALHNIKNNIKSICKKYRRGDEKELCKAVKAVQNYLFFSDKHGRDLFDYYTGLCSKSDSFVELDNYCKDTLRSVFTGRHNVKHNSRVDIRSFGWVSLVYIYNMAKMNFYAYKLLMNTITKNFKIKRCEVCDLSVADALAKLEEKWEYISTYNCKSNIFYHPQADDGKTFAVNESRRVCFLEALNILRRCDWKKEAPFIVSKKYPTLVILDYWFL